MGGLPIRNYTTNLAPPGVDLAPWEPHALREGFDHRGHQCNACGMHHCHMQVVRSGKRRGQILDEPEYEGWVGSGWAFGATDPEAVSWMNTQCDRAAVDVNEFGWLVGWVMECFEKGWLGREQLGGLEPRWGDVEAANALLQLICRREGIGDLLAEGVKRASERVGGPAADAAIYTMKGATPRGHDHRTMWEEMLDTCTSSTATIESAWAVRPQELGLPAMIPMQDPDAVPKRVAGLLGRRHFEDSLGACVFTTGTTLENLATALNAVTGWTYSRDEAMRFGRRTAALLRAFNLRCGIGPELEYPSARYGSTPHDGPSAGISTRPHWEHMLDVWYEQVGYDRKTGKPLPELLDRLGLPRVKADLWGGE
jgi:aldehyde:ferredoxin oxidoreductase